jgi:hypothetical protein
MAYRYQALSIKMRFDYTSIQMRIAICRDIWPIVSERWQGSEGGLLKRIHTVALFLGRQAKLAFLDKSTTI